MPVLLRGILPDGTPVTRGMKSGDVDPRGKREYCDLVSDKALAIGGGAPVVIQSMLNTKTTDVEGSLKQIRQLASAGCQIARLAGMPRCARLVGYAMAACQDPGIPCHRVVDRMGGTKAAFDILSPGTQRALLEAEGVAFLPDGRVDMARHQWTGEDETL